MLKLGTAARTISALLAMTAVSTGTACAATLQTTDATHPWQQWANSAQVPTFSGPVPLTVAGPDAACGDDAGCTAVFPNVDQTTGAILPGPPESVNVQIATGDPADMERGYLYHELGHVFDAEYMTSTDRAQFMAIDGLSGGSDRWWYSRTLVANGVTIAYSPGEWFAESYRMCATWGVNQPPSVNTFEDYGYPGDKPAYAAQQREACQLIDTIGVREGVATPAQQNYQSTKEHHATTQTQHHRRVRRTIHRARRHVLRRNTNPSRQHQHARHPQRGRYTSQAR